MNTFSYNFLLPIQNFKYIHLKHPPYALRPIFIAHTFSFISLLFKCQLSTDILLEVSIFSLKTICKKKKN